MKKLIMTFSLLSAMSASADECFSVKSISVNGVRSNELIVTLYGTENKLLLQDLNSNAEQAALGYVVQTAAASGKEICGKYTARTWPNGTVSPDFKNIANAYIRF